VIFYIKKMLTDASVSLEGYNYFGAALEAAFDEAASAVGAAILRFASSDATTLLPASITSCLRRRDCASATPRLITPANERS
jgi:hypothetical protein